MHNLFSSRVDFKLFKYNLKIHKTYIILFSVLLFLTFPGPILLSLIRHENVSNIGMYQGEAILVLVIVASILFFLAPFITHQYLNSKKAVDVFHALPITRNNLFLTNLLSTFLMVFIPFTLNYCLGFILASTGGAILSTQTLTFYLLSVVLFLALQVPNYFVIMNTGTLSNSIVHSFILFLAPFVTYGALSMFVETFVLGVSSFDQDLLSYISPLAAIIRGVTEPAGMKRLILAVYWAVASIIFLCISFNLYNKRKSERAEEPFINERYFPWVVSLFTALSLLGLLSMFTNVWGNSVNPADLVSRFISLESALIPLGVTYVAYIILDIFRFKSTKHFLKASLNYLMIAVITMSFGVLLISTKFFGYGNYVPNTDNVSHIKVSFPSQGLFIPTDSGYNTELSLDSKESIEEFTAIHHELIQFYEENPLYLTDSMMSTSFPYYADNHGDLRFTYKMNGMINVNRNYSLPSSFYNKLEQMLDNVDVQVSLNPIIDMDRRITKPASLFNSTFSEVQQFELTDTFRAGLKEAYLKDIEQLGLDGLKNKTGVLQKVIRYTYANQQSGGYNETISAILALDTRYENTLKYLDEAVTSTPLTYATSGYIYAPHTGESRAFHGTIYHGFNNYLYNDGNEIYLSNSADAQRISEYLQGSYYRNLEGSVLVIEFQDGYVIHLPLSPSYR